VAAIYIVGYLAFSVPALIAGVATTTFGLHLTALVYSASLAVLAAAAVGILLVRPAASPAGWPQLNMPSCRARALPRHAQRPSTNRAADPATTVERTG